MLKRILATLLSLTAALSLCACAPGILPGGDGTAPEALIGDGTSFETFIARMTEVKERGDQASGLGLPVHSEYYYSFAGASVSALRYAAEFLLWLKGEGDTLASFTSGSRYTGWDRIAEINYASPYPAYFEGLILEARGRFEECAEPYAWASIMPAFPKEGLDFYYLKKMSVDDLYGLRDRLRALEDTIYAAYTPALTGAEWDRNNFDTEYLAAKSRECIQNGDHETALWYSKQALKADPFTPEVWSVAAMCAMYAQDLELMGAYVDEGLAVFPEDETLLMLRGSMIDAVNEMEAGR